MCQTEILEHKGYERLKVFRFLNAEDGNALIGHYISNNPQNNELTKNVLESLWEENKKQKRSVKDLIEEIEKKNNVSIIVEEIPYLPTKKIKKEKTRKMYLFITKNVM